MCRWRTGDLVAFDAGVIVGGYVGELGRTHAVGGDQAIDPGLAERWSELWDRLLTACRPGAPLSDLWPPTAGRGSRAPPMPVARGLGLGFDLPLVTHALPGEAAGHQVETGMVLVLTAYVWKEGVGRPLRRGTGGRDVKRASKRSLRLRFALEGAP